MRRPWFALVLIAPLAIAAAPPAVQTLPERVLPPGLPGHHPDVIVPNQGLKSPQARSDRSAVCRGRIEEARQERGLPKLDSDKADDGDPLFIAAVDRMMDGCEVLVMRNNLADIRPLPARAGPARLRPAH